MNSTHILTLLNTPKFGKKSVQDVVKKTTYSLSSLSDLLDSIQEARKTNGRIPVPSKNDLEVAYSEADRLMNKSLEMGITILNSKDKSYPTRFHDLKNQPILIHAMGDINCLNDQYHVAVIGTREPSEKAYKIGERFAEVMTQSGFNIISGLALGCDTAGHEGCLKANGKTIGILAGGLDKIYPAKNKGLAKEIVETGGCLISEYAIKTRTFRSNFVERDRLQSGLSEGIFVVQTDVKGGTMHTVKFAIEQGRKIACLAYPENEFFSHPKFRGNSKLIVEEKAIGIRDGEGLNQYANLLKLAADNKNKLEKNTSKKTTDSQMKLDL